MSIAVFAHSHLPLEEVVAALRRSGIDAFSIRLDSNSPTEKVASSIEKCALVTREPGVMFVGEHTSLIRKIIGPEIPLILCTLQVTAPDRRTLHKCGASEVITPGGWSASHVAERILAELIRQGYVQPSSFGALRGATPAIRELYQHIHKVASLAEPILIVGETGTGKELVAREIHSHSGRPDKFFAINCAELSPELLGSELFGHERGAFTNAVQARKGLLSEAGAGTVFLDEISDLDLSAQAKLLRVIEDQEVRPIGSNRWHKSQARIVLATNRNLKESCAEGKFRRDLYERIRGFTLELPPLRERKADIPLLADYFVEEYNQKYPGDRKLPAGALDPLFRYDWQGNVRELRSVIRKAATYADNAGRVSTVILQEAVRSRDSIRPKHYLTFDPATDTWRDLLKRVQENYLRAVLEEARGDKEAAAKLAGMSRTQFYEKLKELETKK